jgi:2-methylisocitrate lyase-like PEP mutase family enzyme
VRGYEAAGVQAIQIEDQETPKKCGHTPNRRVIPSADMCRKIEVAIDARTSPDTLIIARTDSRTGLGIDEAIRRGKEYAKAGADIVFVEAPESEDEFKRAGAEIDCWLLANMVPTGKSPVVPADTLKSFGFNIAIYPSSGMSVACAALSANYGYLKSHGSTAGSPVPAFTMEELHELTGFPEVWAFEKRFSEV